MSNSLGFWNGRRGFQALLREDPKGHGGYLHPPAMFSLGADRGTLFYTRQPPFCRRCMAYGHIFASCSTRKCRFCGSEEHEAKDCDKPKACHGCGSSAHLWRGCPARQRSYARCMAYGHIFASCSTIKCRFCGSEEHEARDCGKPKACHGCGSSAHLWRACPGTPEPNTIPASWVGEMEEEGGMSGVRMVFSPVDMEQGSIG
uniref:CCHC-type domain-containing protein n=1 Tax=Oncorhynchus kisutch TaxID=8019 RepID=A0A8C7F4X2_ONCKI